MTIDLTLSRLPSLFDDLFVHSKSPFSLQVVGRQRQELRFQVVHDTVDAQAVILRPAVDEIFASIDRGVPPFAPLVIVGDHLRPEECLYAEPNALDLGEQQTKKRRQAGRRRRKGWRTW